MHKDKYFEAVDAFSITSITDLKGRILSVNDNFCNISGYSRAELLGKPHRLISSGYHSKAFWGNMWKTIKRGEAWMGEVKNKRKDGEYYWVYTLITPIRNERGNIVEYFSQRFDITEKKELEEQKQKDQLNLQIRDEELQSQHEELLVQMQQINELHNKLEAYNERLKDALDFSPLWVFTLDAQLQVQFANKSFLNRFPYFPKEGEATFFDYIESTRLSTLVKECMTKQETFNLKGPFNLSINGAIEYFFLDITAIPKIEKGHSTSVTVYVQDRTLERKNTRHQEELGEILEKASTEIYIFRQKDLRFIFLNDIALKMTGYSKDEIFNLTPLAIKPNYTPKGFHKLLQHLHASEQKSVEFSTVHRRKDKTEYLIRLILQPVSYLGVPAYLAVGRDVTVEELKSEIMLSVSKTAKVAGWVYTPKDRKLILSGSLDDILLINNAQVFQSPELLYQSLSIESHTKREQALKQLLAQEISSYDLELESFDGQKPVWIREIVKANTASRTEIENVVGAVQDITEVVMQRQIEHKLHARYRIAAQAANLGIFEWNLKENRIYWDKSMQALYDTSKSEVSVEEWLEFIHINDRTDFLKQVTNSQQGRSRSHEIHFQVANTKKKTIHILQYLERIENKETNQASLIGVNINVTPFKEAENKLAKLNQELIEKNSDLSQFTYITSHNLRAPLANIIGLVELFDKENLQNPFNVEIIKNTQESAEKLDVVIQDLVKVIDIQRARKQRFTTIDLEEVINRSLDSFQNDFRVLEADIDRIIESNLPIKGIYSYVQSIFENLIGNAIKYRHSDRKLELVIRAKKYADYTVASVTDNGIGIDLKENKGKVFGFYQRFHTKRPGKGLGLYMVKNQIEAMGGQIAVQSFPDKGTTFVLYFPNKY